MFKKANVIAAAIAVLSVNAYAQDGNALLHFTGQVYGGGSTGDLTVNNAVNGTIAGEATASLVETDTAGTVDLVSDLTDVHTIKVTVTRADISVNNTLDGAATVTVDLVMDGEVQSDVGLNSEVNFAVQPSVLETLSISPEWAMSSPLSVTEQLAGQVELTFTVDAA
ncbi:MULTISPECIES: hypothetical protein [Vibrio]|uniref:hypothetical protein n=1 Tax=Vibrio TaxID=662 RepID=UPI00030C066E|nr:hypothetical protein [Vibrio crassostreae]OEE86574.1 hypothetical protein A140_09990 [Vibrio crassostreae 9ZC88]